MKKIPLLLKTTIISDMTNEEITGAIARTLSMMKKQAHCTIDSSSHIALSDDSLCDSTPYDCHSQEYTDMSYPDQDEAISWTYDIIDISGNNVEGFQYLMAFTPLVDLDYRRMKLTKIRDEREQHGKIICPFNKGFEGMTNMWRPYLRGCTIMD